jgi:RNA polymerase sigma-70 factor (ECF subfamily)
MKATPEEYAFHQRLLSDNDLTASAEFAEWLYPVLVRETYARACSNTAGGSGAVDWDLVEEAVGQALLDYIEAPERYDAEDAPLQRYLVMAAYRDFQNLRGKEARRTQPQRYLSLLNTEEECNVVVDEAQDVEQIIGRIHAEALWQVIEEHFPDPTERQIVELMVDRVRPVQPYAQLLGLTDLPADEQAKRVNRVKDRIKKRLRRIGGNLNE